jgi:hypothetical protein
VRRLNPGAETSREAQVTAATWVTRRHVHFPHHYLAYIFLAVLDFVTTYLILMRGGREVNGVAARILESFGSHGLLLFKIASVVLVIVLCEVIASRKPGVGRALAYGAIAISAFPVIVGWTQLAAY